MKCMYHNFTESCGAPTRNTLSMRVNFVRVSFVPVPLLRLAVDTFVRVRPFGLCVVCAAIVSLSQGRD